MYDLTSATIAEVADWNGVTYTLEIMNRTGNFIDGDTIRGVESNAIYTLGTFSTFDNQALSTIKTKQLKQVLMTLLIGVR